MIEGADENKEVAKIKKKSRMEKEKKKSRS